MTREIKPFGPRIAVVDPPAEEATTSSGLIVPATLELERCHVGIVVKSSVELSEEELELYSHMRVSLGGGQGWSEQIFIKSGMLVYYQGIPFRIDDLKIVNLQDIVAYEEA